MAVSLGLTLAYWYIKRVDVFRLSGVFIDQNSGQLRMFPAVIYFFKVNNGNARIICDIGSKLTIKAPTSLTLF